jgi:hypothetical protein
VILRGEIGGAITHSGRKGAKRPEIPARFIISHQNETRLSANSMPRSRIKFC